MALAPINPRDFTAVVPDGDVNRHVGVSLTLDTETGAILGSFDLNAARVRDGEKPHEDQVDAGYTTEEG